jgi:threonine synthase
MGKVHKYPDLDEMRRHIFSASISDEETRKNIKRIYESYGTILEPHGAVGWKGLELYLAAYGGESLSVSMETAHPAKFPEEIKALLNILPELPPSMQELESKTGMALPMDNDYDKLKVYLQKHLRAGD